MWILALDVGTSSIRAIGYDALGRPLPDADARVGCEPTTTPDGGSEPDQEELVAATALAIDRCAASAPGSPTAVGASVFWHSLLALDGDGRPLTGVITWADTRSAGAAKALRTRLDETAVHARTGAPLHSTFFPAKLTWLREARPDVFARAATWCGFAEYLLLRLTGRLRASVSMASGTSLLPGRRAEPCISLATTAPQILRALVEAVAYRLAAIYDRLAPVASPGHSVIASGGALGHSRVFTQVLAAALGVPIEVREGTEASSRGAALLALGAMIGRPAPPPEPSGSQVRPDPRRRDFYAAARTRQGRLYESVVGPRVS
jgi:sugar (pentulose or hexulose) kinase